MVKATIITGTSFYSGTPVVGIAFPGDANGVAFTKWADKVAVSGRYATVRPVKRGDKATTITRIRQDWQDWADREGIDLRIAKTVRKNVGAF